MNTNDWSKDRLAAYVVHIQDIISSFYAGTTGKDHDALIAERDSALDRLLDIIKAGR